MGILTPFVYPEGESIVCSEKTQWLTLQTLLSMVGLLYASLWLDHHHSDQHRCLEENETQEVHVRGTLTREQDEG